jgi:hypothetical protein
MYWNTIFYVDKQAISLLQGKKDLTNEIKNVL